jgi:glycosyltransferase involved in cell wall biosynthesis
MFTNSYNHWTHEDFLGPDEKWRTEDIDGISVVWLKTRPYKGNGLDRALNMLSNMKRCYEASKVIEEKPDVIIAPSVPIGTGWVGYKIAKSMGAKFIYEVRDVWPIALVDNGGLSKKHPFYLILRSMEKSLYKRSDAISATMPYLDKHVEESGSDSSKITWLPNGVDLKRFDGLPDYDGGKKNIITVMYVGGFAIAHDVITIIKAAEILRDKGINNLDFIIIGNGVNKKDCVTYAKERELANIEFRDQISKTDIPKVQQESDVLVAAVTDSPIYRFGINLNKLLDYFASGRPVVFSGNAPNDFVADAKAGYSIPPEDASAMADVFVKFLEMSPAERAAMGKNGRKYIEKFSMEKLGKKMESLIVEVCEKRSE